MVLFVRYFLKIHNLKVEIRLSTLKYSLSKAIRGGAVFRAVGVMPSKGDGASTDTH